MERLEERWNLSDGIFIRVCSNLAGRFFSSVMILNMLCSLYASELDTCTCIVSHICSQVLWDRIFFCWACQPRHMNSLFLPQTYESHFTFLYLSPIKQKTILSLLTF